MTGKFERAQVGEFLKQVSIIPLTTVRLNDLCRVVEQALARAAGRFRLVPI